MARVAEGAELRCGRCGRAVYPKHARYLFLFWGERGACVMYEPGNVLFGRGRDEQRVVLCGCCGDEFREGLKLYMLGSRRLWLAELGLE